MDLNQRALAARQFVMNQVKKSPLVQAVQQKSFKPYKKALSNALEPGSLMPMGKAKSLKPINPLDIRKATSIFNNESAQFKAMQHLDSAQATANRIKQFHAQEQARKAKEMMARAFSGFIQRSKNMSNFQNGL